MNTNGFISILFPTPESRTRARRVDEPDCFRDLRLGSLFAGLADPRGGADLREFYYTMLDDPAVIRYRQDVLRDLDDPETNAAVTAFSRRVFEVRRFLLQFRGNHPGPRSIKDHPLDQGRLLNSALNYNQAVKDLGEFFSAHAPASEGLRRFAAYLESFTASERFAAFSAAVTEIREAMDAVDYCLTVRGNILRVEKYAGQEDFSAYIQNLFERFRVGDVNDYRHRVLDGPVCEKTEEAILGMVRGLYPDAFKALDRFCEEWFDFDEEPLLDFSREVQFYLRWLRLIDPLRKEGLSFCIPDIREDKTRLSCRGAFDIVLARQIDERTVTNDFTLDAPERLIVITGPNQGGKTTFTRAVGQIHYIAALGLSVPGKSAELFLCRKILTHYEREEDLSYENGKLRDDLLRLRDLMDAADDRSLVLINEIFASTTAEDALALGKIMMTDLIAKGCLGVIVTFLDELASVGPETVSMMSIVNDTEERERTFKIRRKAPDGLAFAMHIAHRHGLTAEQLKRRLGV